MEEVEGSPDRSSPIIILLNTGFFSILQMVLYRTVTANMSKSKPCLLGPGITHKIHDPDLHIRQYVWLMLSLHYSMALHFLIPAACIFFTLVSPLDLYLFFFMLKLIQLSPI